MRMLKDKRTLLVAFVALVAVCVILALVAGGAFVLKVKSCAESGVEAELVSKPSLGLESESAMLGADVPVKALVKCPWGSGVGEVSISPGKGLQVAGTPYAKGKSLGWGWGEYEIHGVLQGYRTGEAGTSKMELVVSRPTGTPPQRIEVEIPGFKVEPLKVSGDELALAGKIEERRSVPWKWIVVGVLAVSVMGLALLAGLAMLLRKKSAPPLSLWDAAIAAMQVLKGRLASGAINPEQCLAELSDIVRRYLERRFGLRAGRQTTVEFLGEMERGGSPLDMEQRSFLKDFLNAADMVKFAKLPAEKGLIEDAIEKACRLVKETMPADKEGGRKS